MEHKKVEEENLESDDDFNFIGWFGERIQKSQKIMKKGTMRR